ncbi:MAG: trypsin-like peptidase domain-containing protein [Candidatus Niyogibacteria bacterium]|nr:trypsin-like peptidase domain-containing protein [Candidatus Niyogibacteria bacterium]
MKRNLMAVFLAVMMFFVLNFIPQFSAAAETQTQNLDFEFEFASIIRKANKAVVVIEVKRIINDVIRNFTLGNGVFVSEDGYILTNYHVVRDFNEDDLAIHYLPASEDHQSRYIGDLNAMRQRLRSDVKIVNYDEEKDLALLKIDGHGFSTIKFGDNPKVGDQCFAIGSPLGLNWTVTQGSISKEFAIINFKEEYSYFIQTDTAINSGNSGGPLLNMKGELIGLNSILIAPTGHPINAGLNMAVPIGDIQVLLPRLLEEKTKLERSYLGITFVSPYQEIPKKFKTYVAEDRNGIFITDVEKESPAELAGLQIGDIIQTIDGRQIIGPIDFSQTITLQKPGKIILAEIQRQGKIIKLSIILKKKTDESAEIDLNIIDTIKEEKE